MTVCFGSSTTKAAAEDLMCKDGKGYMVRIQKDRLVKEMLGQRARLRKAVFEEQVRQKQEGILDIDAMEAVASAQSKWGVESPRVAGFCITCQSSNRLMHRSDQGNCDSEM